MGQDEIVDSAALIEGPPGAPVENTRYAIRLIPERVKFTDLRKGDVFYIRNEDGTLVDPADGVLVAGSDGFVTEDGVETVQTYNWGNAVGRNLLP